MSTAKQVSFGSFVDPTNPVGSQVMLDQIQRQRALADALRSQSMEEIHGNGGRISWTQGAAKLAQALAARSITKKADTQTQAYGQQVGSALRNMFGVKDPGAGAMPPPQAPASSPQPTADAPPQPTQQPNPQAASSPQAGPPSAPSLSAGGGMGAYNLTGDPQRDMALYSMNPEEYGKAIISAGAPGDFAKLLRQSGVDPTTPLGQQLMQSQLAKQNYVPSETGRPGAIARDPFSKKIIAVDPQNIEGANPVIKDGQFSGEYTQAPGAAGVKQSMEAAGAVGKAAGDVVQVYNPQTQQMEMVPKSAVLGGDGRGGGFAAAPPLGATAAANVTGTNSANDFKAISDGAADVPNRLFALGQMEQIANDPHSTLGPGSPTINKIAGTLNTLGIPISAQGVTNAQEFGKWASQYSARSAQELGLSGSDARVQIAIHATPNGEMNAASLKAIIPQMKGLENAKQGYATAANAWQQTHGPQTVQQFRTEWNKVYDPKIYTLMAQGPQAFAAQVSRMKPAEAAALRQKYLALKQIGALPQ